MLTPSSPLRWTGLLAGLIAMACGSLHGALAVECGKIPISDSLTAGSLPNAVNLDKGTTAQPPGGPLVFTIPTTALQGGAQLAVCFRWRPRDQHAEQLLQAKHINDWSLNLPLRVINSQTDLTTVRVEVPARIGGVKKNHVTPNLYEHDGIWPLADFRVVIAGADNKPVLDEIIPISITNYWIAAAVAVLGTLLFWTGVRCLARRRRVPGGFILSVICNQNGYASLSQLQIMLWTVVIGTALVYIMMLSGRLLDIPTETLALLGIAGAASVAAAVPKAATDGQASGTTPQAPAAAWPPGAVTDVRAAGNPGDTGVVLSWAPPDGGGTPATYAVEYRLLPGGVWTGAAGGGALVEGPFEVTGLTAGSQYQFRVMASNPGGPGAATECGPITTAAAGGAARPVAPTGLAPRPDAAQPDRVEVGWTATTILPDAYVVSFRRAGANIWTVADLTGPAATTLVIDELTSGIDYEFQVRAVTAGQLGPASNVASARTAPVTRQPQLIDLVVWDGTHEIDVTRLQMLFFTLVAAFFVSLKVVAQNEIPTIPDGLLTLMGLSNGVYLTSKFVTGRRS